MLHELRTLARGVGVREAERLVADRFAGVFLTEVGTMGEIVIVSPEPLDGGDRPTGRGGGEGRLAGGLQGSQTSELLSPGATMKQLEPQELGKVWELSWLDFPVGEIDAALAAYSNSIPAREKYYPVVGHWKVTVGFTLDRIYMLSPFKDWEHRHQLVDLLGTESGWPPQLPVAPLSGGTKLMLPMVVSGLK
jgi:hypothetical protein